LANNQNFIVKNGLTVGGNQLVIDQYGNWVGPQTAYANASFAVANVKSHTYTQDTVPATANIGDFWIDSSNGIEYLYTTSNSTNIWVEYGPIGSLTGNITFSDQTIIGSVANRDLTIQQQGTGNIILQTANVYTTGTIHIANHTFANTDAALHIIGSDDGSYQTPANPGYMIQVTGRANTPSRIINDSYGVGTYGVLAHRTGRGSANSPGASLAGDVIGRFSASAYDGTQFPPLGIGRIDIISYENQSPTNKGSQIQFWTTPVGTNNLVQIATFNGLTVEFTGNVVSNNSLYNTSYFSNIKVDGNIYYNVSTSAANTTQYINYLQGGQQQCAIAGTTTVSHINIVPGRQIVLVVSNSSGSDQTINLGVPPNNCTATRAKNGNYSAPSNTATVFNGTTSFFTFYSFDGTTANIYCSITAT
jgi:hypothetical protein